MGSMSEAYRYLKILGPQVPSILKSGLWHSLGISAESSKWDAKTNLVITTVRAVLSKSSTPIIRQQIASIKDPGVRGAVWAAPVTLPVGEQDDLHELLFEAIDDLKDSPDQVYTKPPLGQITAEWQGYRSGADANTPPPEGATPADIYGKLMSDVKSPTTICYFHGGAHYLMDPSTHRPVVQQICKRSGARALSIRYRMAPKYPFPTALLDCLVGYLSLLYPPEGSLHEPVRPEDVVFAGDSAGGNICLALVACLLHLQRKAATTGARTVKFNGQMIPLPLPLPGGVAMASPWTDLTRCMPSLVSNNHYDYLPLPAMSATLTPAAGGQYTFDYKRMATRIHIPGETKNPFPCELWPELPPRADLYVDGSMLCHPMASPLAAPVELWKGAPPVFMLVGEEMLADEAAIVARRLHAAGVKVRWAGFEAMPHVFPMMFGPINCAVATVAKAYDEWGGWIGGLANVGKCRGKEIAMEGGTWFSAPALNEAEVNLSTLAMHVNDDECKARMNEEKRRRCEAYEQLVASAGGGSKL